MSESQIILKFGINDGQLLQLWISFMLHNHWIQKDKDGKWFVTKKGRTWAEKFPL